MRAKQLLVGKEQARVVLSALWREIAIHLTQGKRLELEIREEVRSNPQNRRLHALIDEIADEVEWAGKKRDAETWKRLLVSAWCREKGESVEILPALDGHGVDLVPVRTSKLDKADTSDLMDYVESWAAVHLPAVVVD